MEPKEKKAFEPTGLVPRSIVRTFERFRQQLLPGSERAAIREYRISRYQVLVSARCLFALLTIPIATNWFVSSWLLSPIIEHYWNTQQNEIFLNSYQEERAFAELEFFSDKLFFESLLSNQTEDSKNPKGYQTENNIEITKRSNFLEENHPLLFLSIEQLKRPFGRLPNTQFCGENYFVKAVGEDGMRPEQNACTSHVSLPPTVHILSGSPNLPIFSRYTSAPLHLYDLIHPVNEKEGVSCIVHCVKHCKLDSTQSSSRIHELNTTGCQGQTTEKNPFHFVQSFKPNYNSATPIIYNNHCLPSQPFPRLNCKSSDMAISNTSPGLTGIFGSFNSSASVVFHASPQPSKVIPLHLYTFTPKVYRVLCTVYQGAQCFQRRLPSFFTSSLQPLSLYTEDVKHCFIQSTCISSIHVYTFAPSLQLLSNSQSELESSCKEGAKASAWRAEDISGEGLLLKIVNSDPLKRETTTARKQYYENQSIEGTEEFACCTSGVNLIGNFYSQIEYRKQIPKNGDLMQQLELNTSASNKQKVQILKSRQAPFVDRQLHYSAPLSVENSIDIWNTNNTENSVKIKERIQEKIVELAVYYNEQTILSITNIAGDFISVLTLGFLFIWMKPEISILKSFLIEAIYSLSDTTKSFLLILLTDLLVGFHSPRGWETALELLLKHFGLPENQDFVFLFVATFPVLLDTVFKYWIFRHLNKISPSTVATYHSMIE